MYKRQLQAKAEAAHKDVVDRDMEIQRLKEQLAAYERGRPAPAAAQVVPRGAFDVVPDVEVIEDKTGTRVVLSDQVFFSSGSSELTERGKKTLVQVADILKRHDTLLLEDDPYSDLRYSGERVPPIKSLAPEHVVYSTTLSKTFAPGLRIGVCIAPEFIQRWLVTARQGVDLHTNTLAQALAAEYLTGGYLDRQLPRIIELYAPRQLAMLDALERHMPEDFTWSHPEGGIVLQAIEGNELAREEDGSRLGHDRVVAQAIDRFAMCRDRELQKPPVFLHRRIAARTGQFRKDMRVRIDDHRHPPA